jgi:hypothetical protein
MTYRVDRKLPGEDWKPRVVVEATLELILEFVDTLTESNPGNEYKAVRLKTQEEIDNAIQD